MATYLYRQGDGNEGNYPQFHVTLADSDNPWHAIRALMANRYIPGSRTRSHVMNASHADGEEEFSILGTVYEGPKGETAFDAAWLTAELQPATADDMARCVNIPHYETLRDALDLGAWRFYRRLCAKG